MSPSSVSLPSPFLQTENVFHSMHFSLLEAGRFGEYGGCSSTVMHLSTKNCALSTKNCFALCAGPLSCTCCCSTFLAFSTLHFLYAFSELYKILQVYRFALRYSFNPDNTINIGKTLSMIFSLD